MDEMQLVRLLQLLLAMEDCYRNEAEYYTYLIQRRKSIPPDLLVKYYTALVRLDVFDKMYNAVYNILNI